MTPEQWQQARDILHEALEYDPGRRTAFLTEACSDNDALRSEVEVTGDIHRLARFEREARVLATLNHSNIGAIYGVEDALTDEGAVLCPRWVCAEFPAAKIGIADCGSLLL